MLSKRQPEILDENLAKYAPLIDQIVSANGVKHLLDYNCGEGAPLKDHIQPILYQAYDESVPAFAGLPVKADLVVDIAAQPQDLEALERLSERLLFIQSDTTSPVWWLYQLLDRFEIQTYQLTETGFWAICNHQELEIGDDT